MKMAVARFLVVALMCVGAQAASFITPCGSGDKECAKQQAQTAWSAVAGGVPEAGLEAVDPLFIDKIVASQAGLDMNFKDSTVKGLRDCKVDSAKRDVVKNKLKVEAHCDLLVTGQYKLGGRLLILPIEGQGKYSIDLKQIMLKLSMDYSEEAGHWHVTDWKHVYRPDGPVVFKFQNLFNGNKELSDAIHTFANANYKEILSEVGPPIMRVLFGRMVDAIERTFAKVPANELASD